jgi:toxin FitB
MYLVDTNVISELRKLGAGKADAGVVAWLAGVDAASLYVSAITILELERGILRLERRDARQGALLRTWMDEYVLPEFAARVLPVDTAVARRCARLQVPDPRPDADALIAATAMAHGLALVTRNVTDFQPFGIDVINPFQ